MKSFILFLLFVFFFFIPPLIYKHALKELILLRVYSEIYIGRSVICIVKALFNVYK